MCLILWSIIKLLLFLVLIKKTVKKEWTYKLAWKKNIKFRKLTFKYLKKSVK